ncbi:MAG: hypothetical protein PHT31_01585 [Candidatus Omnitrophica bacterium]|nr:hypothetical protein [Candidatus Omnitrophota bacterium]
MFTIFTCPKPFVGQMLDLQLKAIRSWMQVKPAAEILLLGDALDTCKVANDFGLRHLPDIEKNALGTPLVNSIFEKAEAAASFPLICYVNTDILFFGNFSFALKAAQKKFKKFLLTGRRYDLDNCDLEISGNWQEELLLRLKARGRIQPYGSDYFLFPKGTFKRIPPFALGRGAWDNWLVYYLSLHHTAVIDVSGFIYSVHQAHDYSHILGQNQGKTWKGQEADYNKSLGGEALYFYAEDIIYRLDSKGIRINFLSLIFLYLTKLYLAFPFMKRVILKAKRLKLKFCNHLDNI